jgi:glycosyltransferase involved in cell wall biosynthesis
MTFLDQSDLNAGCDPPIDVVKPNRRREPLMAEKLRKVCYFGTYRSEYSRNRIMIEGLRQNGVDVVECHVPLWMNINDRVSVASGGWRSPRFWLRAVRAYLRLLRCYLQIGEYDLMVVGYPGPLDVLMAWMLTRLHRKPLVWDIFMSVFLIASERGLASRSAVSVKLIQVLERIACKLPERLILDTDDYIAWFTTVQNVPFSRFALVPTGADDRVFKPQPRPGTNQEMFRVHYHGTFIPNHGLETIVEAAHLLAGDSGIVFELVGDGPDRSRVETMVDAYGLRNLHVSGWMEADCLVQHMAVADVCLGVFGITAQSLMTVPNKIYEGLAMAKPVITGDSSAVRKVLQDGFSVVLVERANPQQLADAIVALRADPVQRGRVAANGHQQFLDHFRVECIGKSFVQGIQDMVP